MNEVVILAGKRSPIGAFQGSLAPLSAPKIAAPVIQNLVRESKIPATDIQEIIMGEVLTAGVGQAPARQALIFSDLPNAIPATTINKVCGSGLQSIYFASLTVQQSPQKVVIAGGMESMTQGPYFLPQVRKGARMGNSECIDSVIHDGLWDCYNKFHMGNAGELCAREYKFSREAQDDFAKRSYTLANQNVTNGHFKKEVVPLLVAEGRKEWTAEIDEEPAKGNPDKMSSLKPAFSKDGTITAANASSLSDGAAACLVSTREYARNHGIKNTFTVRGFAHFAHQPEWFTTAPVGAMKILEQKTGIKMKDVDAFEINEAFAVVPMVAIKQLGLSIEKVNPRGGAIALGHPIGCSGTRILVTLMNHLHATRGRLGVASLCIGGGEGIAILIEQNES